MSNALTNRCKLLVLTSPQKAVVMCLADRADDDGSCYRPSIPSICAWTCLGRTAVIRALKAIEAVGLIQVKRAIGDENRISFFLDRLPVARVSDQCEARTSARGEPVPEAYCTSAADAPHPVRETDWTRPSCAPYTPYTGTPSTTQQVEIWSGSQRSAPKKRMPADWTPPAALIAWAASTRPDLDLDTVVEVFRNHYIGKGEARASWDASFRTWVLRERGRSNAIGTTPAKHSGFAQKNYRDGIETDGSFH